MNKKTVVIAGASSGIGLALAMSFLEQGFNVVANSRSNSRLEAARRELCSPEGLLTVEDDIGQPETAKRLFAAATGDSIKCTAP